MLHQPHLRKSMRPDHWLYLVLGTLCFLNSNYVTVAATYSRQGIMLMLPRQAIISLVNGQSISGVQVTFLSQTKLSYVKGGNRSLPLSNVRSLSFREPNNPQQKRSPKFRGDEPKGCRQPYQLMTNTRLLSLQKNGSILAVTSDGMDSLEYMNLQGPSSRKKLVVIMVRFDSNARVLIKYMSCS